MAPAASVTLKTVAEACGLAVTTVSRALNGHDDIALSTREKVRQIADEIGYVPNRQGKALRTGQTFTISLLVPSHTAISGYTSSIIFSMGALLRDEGYELCAMPDYPEQNDLGLIRSIVENRRCDGVILTRTTPQDIRVRYLLEKEIPFVTHGRTELATAHAFVDFDNEGFTEQAANRLIDNGCDCLMLIGPPRELTYANHMKLGFNRAVNHRCVEAIQAPEGISLETPLTMLREIVCRLFRSENRPDGIVCGSELTALVVLAAINDAGLTPGEDICVIAKQTSSVLDHSYPPIDACHEDIDATGNLLAKTLMALIRREKPVSDLTTIIKPEFRWRTEKSNSLINSQLKTDIT